MAIRTDSPSSSPPAAPIAVPDEAPSVNLTKDSGKAAADQKAYDAETKKHVSGRAEVEKGVEHKILTTLKLDGVDADDPRVVLAALMRKSSSLEPRGDVKDNGHAAAAFFQGIVLGKRDPAAIVAEPFSQSFLAEDAATWQALPAPAVKVLFAANQEIRREEEATGTSGQAFTPSPVLQAKLAQLFGAKVDTVKGQFEQYKQLAQLVESNFFHAQRSAAQAKDAAPSGFVAILEPKLPELAALLKPLLAATAPELGKSDIELPPLHVNKLEQFMLGTVGSLAQQLAKVGVANLKPVMQALKVGADLSGIDPKLVELAAHALSFGERRVLAKQSGGQPSGQGGTEAGGALSLSAETPSAPVAGAVFGGTHAILSPSAAAMDIDALVEWVFSQAAQLEDSVLRDQINEMQIATNRKKAQRAKIAEMNTQDAQMKGQISEEFSALQATGAIAPKITLEQYTSWRTTAWGDGKVSDDGNYHGPPATLVPPNWQDLTIPDWMAKGTPPPANADDMPKTADEKAAASYGLTPEQTKMLLDVFSHSKEKTDGLDFAVWLSETVKLTPLAKGGNIVANNATVDALIGKQTPTVKAPTGNPDRHGPAIDLAEERITSQVMLSLVGGGDDGDIQEVLKKALADPSLTAADKKEISDWMKSDDRTTMRPGLQATLNELQPMLKALKPMIDQINQMMVQSGGWLNWAPPSPISVGAGGLEIHITTSGTPRTIHLPPWSSEGVAGKSYETAPDAINKLLKDFGQGFSKSLALFKFDSTDPYFLMHSGDDITKLFGDLKSKQKQIMDATDPLTLLGLPPDPTKAPSKAPPDVTDADTTNWKFTQSQYDDLIKQNFDANGKFIGDRTKLDPAVEAFFESQGLIPKDTKTAEQVAAADAAQKAQIQKYMDNYGNGTADDPTMQLNHTGKITEFEAQLANEKSTLDSMGDMSELQSTRLQLHMDQRQKMYEALTNLMKKISQLNDSIVQNLK